MELFDKAIKRGGGNIYYVPGCKYQDSSIYNIDWEFKKQKIK